MKRFARGALTLAFWLAVWAALALLVHRELLLPAPWTVVRRLCELAATGAFWRITAVSIGRVLLGVAGAVVLGVALAAACTISKTADALLRPLMTVVKSTPVASFVVLALIWIARDWLPVFIALLMVLPVVWSNVCTGIRSADPALLELARVYGWPRGLVLRRIYVPSVRPHFLAALRSGLGFGWKAGIAAEVLTVPHSAIGRMIYESKLYLQTTDLFAWTLAVILLSVGLERLVLRALTPRMIETRDLTVTYDGRAVLRAVDLTVPDGGHIALMGPSGCGKTTLLRVLAGLRAPDGGTVRVSPGRMACVFQEPRLLPWRTAAENVNAVLSDRAQTMPQALAWLERLELGDARDQYPAALSGGMQQRVAIARALAYDAPLLLLDEPFRGLDAALRQRVTALVADAARAKTLVLATHDAADAAALGCVVYAYADGAFRRDG